MKKYTRLLIATEQISSYFSAQGGNVNIKRYNVTYTVCFCLCEKQYKQTDLKRLHVLVKLYLLTNSGALSPCDVFSGIFESTEDMSKFSVISLYFNSTYILTITEPNPNCICL